MNRWLIVLVFVIGLQSNGVAGNFHTFIIGGRAMGMAGAYTAMCEDSAIAWYNPAGLGFNTRSSLDGSATAYFLEVVKANDLLVTTLPDSAVYEGDFNTTTIQIVPTSLTYTKLLGNKREDNPGFLQQSIALSVFIPQAIKFQKTIMMDQRIEVNGQPVDYHQKLHLQAEMMRYYIGPSWGMRIGDRFAVGASLFVTYSTGIGRGAFTISFSGENMNPIFGLMGLDIETMEVGVASQIGFQARPFGDFRIGFTLRPPQVRLWRRSMVYSIQAGANPFENTSSFNDLSETRSDFHFDFPSPMVFLFGLAWSKPEIFSVALDAEVHTPWKNDADSDLKTRWVVNGHLGCEVFLSPRWLISSGIFTDFAPEKDVYELGDRKIDFFGGTFAVSYTTPYKVVEESKTDRITFGSTIGFKYAYGKGKMMGGIIDFTKPNEAWSLRSTNATMHDISVVISSSLVF